MLPAMMPIISTASSKPNCILVFPHGVFGEWQEAATLAEAVEVMKKHTSEKVVLLSLD